MDTTYFDNLLIVWDKIENHQFSAMELMSELDKCFKMCMYEEEELVYNSFVKLFREKCNSVTSFEKYDHIVSTMCRITKYIHRFWVPSNKKETLYKVAMRLWNEKENQ
jgi:hypothetical protein